MVDDAPLLTRAAVEAAARDAATLLLARTGRWATESEIVRELVATGRSETLAKLAIKHLIDHELVEFLERYLSPPLSGEVHSTGQESNRQ